MSRPKAGKEQNGQAPSKQDVSIKYLHKPPIIQPNYGNQKRSMLPKSKVSRVLLYDNATQDTMLGIRLAHINIERERTTRLINIQSRTFYTRQQRKQKHMKALLESSSSRRARTGLPNIHPPTDRKSDETSESSPRPLSAAGLHLSEDDLRLPEIDPEKRRVVFKVKDTSGNTRVYHTVDEKGDVFSGIIPLHSFYARTTDDPRFQGLANALVPKETEEFI